MLRLILFQQSVGIGQRRKSRGPDIEVIELARKPPLGSIGRHIVGSRAEAEAIERDCGWGQGRGGHGHLGLIHEIGGGRA